MQCNKIILKSYLCSLVHYTFLRRLHANPGSNSLWAVRVTLFFSFSDVFSDIISLETLYVPPKKTACRRFPVNSPVLSHDKLLQQLGDCVQEGGPRQRAC